MLHLFFSAVCILQLAHSISSYVTSKDGFCLAEGDKRSFLTDLDYEECNNSTCPVCPNMNSDCPMLMHHCHICCYTISERMMNHHLRLKSMEYVHMIREIDMDHANKLKIMNVTYCVAIIMIVSMLGVSLFFYYVKKTAYESMLKETPVVAAENEGLDKVSIVMV